MPFGIKLKKLIKPGLAALAAYAAYQTFGASAAIGTEAVAGGAAATGATGTGLGLLGASEVAAYGAGGAVAGTAAGAGAAAAGGLSFGQMAGLTAGSQVLGSVLAPKAQSVSDQGALGDLQRQTAKLAPMPAVVGAKERARAEQQLLRKSGMNRNSTLLSDTLG